MEIINLPLNNASLPGKPPTWTKVMVLTESRITHDAVPNSQTPTLAYCYHLPPSSKWHVGWDDSIAWLRFKLFAEEMPELGLVCPGLRGRSCFIV
ncbi:uncharacterized protein BDW43DRAFT_129912 [Aspergillus alliaceus]|uniref:uncharacterized protein n=1 Tax=Petromyces alliaceus TaxID=209559 RepID=UPI0012A4DA26|nr:uncharacterized protein BDW43DRAFT_129912 [Aspergillus alliaceus]KAB8231910.1 hypothetical protein BDW43DRAFT_129912 [Aspergillus alliaceus]